jgi:membrane protein DedA with SNARE-associated domain
VSAYIAQFVDGLSSESLYVFLFVSAYIENIIPFLPGDTMVVFGAFLVGVGKLDFSIVFAATTAGSLLGFLTPFLLGKRFGRTYFLTKDFRFFPRQSIVEVERWFDRFGYGVILCNRFLSGIRAVVSLFAGIANMKWAPVAILALTSCAIWNGLLIYGGFLLGENWGLVLGVLERYNQIVFPLLMITLAVILWRKRRKTVH